MSFFGILWIGVFGRNRCSGKEFERVYFSFVFLSMAHGISKKQKEMEMEMGRRDACNETYILV